MSLVTPLIDLHEDLGAGMGDFAGWKMPLDYGDMVGEALETRRSVTVFDVSHLTKIKVAGKDALKALELLVAKRVSKLSPGRMIAPTAMLNERAGFVDDVAVYRLGDDSFLIIGNAVNRSKNVKWIEEHTEELDVSVEDVTEKYAMIAIQGPQSPELIETLAPSLHELAPLELALAPSTVGGKALLGSKSGWTGEAGFELIAEPEVASRLFKEAVSRGAKPAGLGARDILRIEMGFCLYGNEIDEDTTPLEARYWVFSWGKRSYIGYKALRRTLEEGVSKVRVGLVAKDRIPIPRTGAAIYAGDTKVGAVTSGTYSPLLGKPVAMGYVRASHALIGARLEVEVRGRKYSMKVVDFPFVK